MSSPLEAVFQSALHLPESDRIELIERLAETLSPEARPELHPAWKVEVKRRAEELDSGRAASIPWDEVRARAWEAVARDGRDTHD